MQEQYGGMRRAVESILSDLVNSAGPRRADGILYAAVPQWFSTDLYRTFFPDDADQLLSWVSKFSFVPVLSRNRTNFMMQPMERAIMNELFIDRDPDEYREVHGRVLDYWLEHPYRDPVVQAQNVLYHRIIVDQEAARQELIDLFEHYVDDRQLGAMEKLLKTAAEACGYLGKLGRPSSSLQELILYMQARHLQLQGNWQESQEMLDDINVEADPGLQPFVTRAYGFAQAGLRDYAGAIEQFQLAVEQFAQNASSLGEEVSQVERADTLVALGDAYIDLAEATISLDERRQRLQSKWRFLHGIYYLFLSLPLAVYMTRAIGLRAWLPHLWSMWRDVDWIKADLYAQATRRFREAGRLLEKIDRPDKNLVAEEKLADLYLSVGDAVEARTLYERLLASTELSDYRRSRVQVGYGQTQWLLDNAEAAEEALSGALPSLRYFADGILEAEAETVLGSIAAQSSDPEAALPHFHRALDFYLVEESPDLVAATNVAEQLDSVAEHPSLSREAKDAARREAARVMERHYPVQQRYRITRFFQQLFLFSVIVLAGIGLQNMLSIDRATVTPEIVFHAFPLLNTTKEEPVSILNTSLAVSSKSSIGSIAGEETNLLVGQGVTSLLIPDPELQLVLAGLLSAFLGYIIAVTVIGILLLRRIDPREVQKTRESTTVRLAQEGLSVGEDAAEQATSFDDVSRYVVSNTNLFKQPISESYLLLEKTAGDQLIISGSTTHYERVQRHIEERLSEKVERVDLSHSLLISLAGVLLLFTVLLYLVMAIVSRLGEVKQFGDHTLHTPISGISYSGVALYPYLLLGFLLPLLWWFVWKPLGRRHRLDTFDWTPFLLIIFGLLVALGITILTGFSSGFRLSTPDLYPALVAVSLVLAGVAALTVRALQRWRASGDRVSEQRSAAADGDSEPQDDSGSGSVVKRVETFSQRVPTSYRLILFAVLYLLLMLVAILMFFYLSREIGAYHRSVQDNEFLKNSNELRLEGDADWQDYFGEARVRYSEEIEAAESERWAVLGSALDEELLVDSYTNRAHISLILAIEDLASKAGVVEPDSSELGQLEAAIEDYKRVVELAPQAPQGYLWLGFAQHTAGYKEEALDNYACALLLSGLTRDSLSAWISSETCPQRDPGSATLEPEHIVMALTGRGWIYFSQEKYAEALPNFLFAVELADLIEPDSEQAEIAQAVSVQAKCEAALGLGYTQYRLKHFDEALQIWQQAEARCPRNAALLTSLGTVKWRLGTLGEDYTVKGSDRCSSNALDEVEKRRVTGLLEESVNYFTKSAAIRDQPPEDRAFTYRTRGQVQYLLRNCPGYNEDRSKKLGEAVNSYVQATKLDRQNSNYWYLLSRLRYAYWLSSDATGPAAREPVVQALVEIGEMMRLDGRTCEEADYEPCSIWYPAIYSAAVDGVLDKGDEWFAERDYETAKGYYELLTGHEPELPESYRAHFGLGFTELAQGNPDVATDWFESGIALAVADDDKIAIGRLWQDLKKLSETDATFDIEPIKAIFDELDFGYDAVTPFERGARALANGDIDVAREAYIEGRDIAVDIGDLESVKIAILGLLDERQEGYDEILDLIHSRLPQLSLLVQSDAAVEETFDLAFIAWALGEAEIAGRWYQEGIRRTALIPGTYFQGLYPARDDLFAYWQQGAPVDASALITEMLAYRPQQLQQHAKLREEKLYWRYQGWFKYHVALKAFLAGDPESASFVLESGKEDTVEAVRVDEAYNQNIYDYLRQGAWSLYYYERAKLAQEVEDYEAAYDDFVSALEAYPDSVTDPRTQGEMVTAMFEAGFAAYKLGDRDRAMHWYETGIKRAEEYGTEDPLSSPRETLQEDEPADEAAADLQADILELLGSD